MRLAALPLLACPSCRAALGLAAGTPEADGHIISGELACACGARYPVVRGVPRLGPGATTAASAETAARFGAQWKTFAHMASYQEAWLRAWLAPLQPECFQGKVVLEAGCGKGRHTVTAAAWGPRALVALDLGDAVDVAFGHSRGLENVHVVQGDILRPPLQRAFDLMFSVGVLHHLPDPRGGFDALRALVVPGGRVAIWVYGRESNEWIVRYVNPLRERVTSRLPSGVLYWATLPGAALLHAATLPYRLPAAAARLPYGAYLEKLAALPLTEVHNIVFDQLTPTIAHYLPEEEVRGWFNARGLDEVEVSWHNRNSWRASARVTE